MNLQNTSLLEVFKTGLHALLQKDKQQQSAIKVIGNHWIARYSNAFKDRENEFFPVKAIDAFIERVDKGLTPLPELWLWHIPKTIGHAKTLFRAGNFVIAAGTFTDDKFGQAAKVWLSKNKAKNSHGFTFDVNTFKDASYHDFNTFEISILPFSKGIEANAYTNIEVKDMSTISAEKRAFLEEMFGKEVATEFISETEKASKDLEEFGVEYKDTTDINNKMEMDDEEDEEDDEEGNKKPFKKEAALYGIMVKELADLAQGQVKLLKTIKAQQKQIEAQAKEIKSLQKDLALPPTQASDDISTVIDEKVLEDDDLLGKLAKALKEKEAKDYDPVMDFWSDAIEES